MAAAGLLNKRIEVYKPVTVTNAVGATSINWEKAFETRANVRNVGMNRGQQRYSTQQQRSSSFVLIIN